MWDRICLGSFDHLLSLGRVHRHVDFLIFHTLGIEQRLSPIAKYTEINVATHPGKRHEMIERANSTSVPQIFANGQHIGDCERIHALDAIGKLDAVLGIA